MATRPFAVLVVAGLMALPPSGCATLGEDDPSTAEARTEARRTATDLARQLDAAGADPSTGAGSFRGCGGPDPEHVEYSVRVGFDPEVPTDDVVDRAERILVDDGWEITASGPSGGEVAFVNADRGFLTASVKESVVDRGTIELGVVTSCVVDDDGREQRESEPLDLR